MPARTPAGARVHVRTPGALARTAELAAPPTTKNTTIGPQTLEDALELSRRFNVSFSLSQHKEHAYAVTKIEGQLPRGLRGTLLRNGPGLFEVGHNKIAQPFDGDGMVSSIAMDGQGNAHFTNKFVRTEGLVKEQRAGKQLYRSAFNRSLPEDQGLRVDLPFGLGSVTLNNPLDMNIKNVANTNVLRWAGKTLALYERGLPYLLTPELETEGTDTLQNTLVAPYVAAHLRIVQEDDGSSRAVMFSTSESGLDGTATFYEYDQSDFKLLHRTDHTMPGAAFGFFHDLAVTEHYYVLLENPMRMDFGRLFTRAPFGEASIAECLQFHADIPAKLHLIPRPGKGVTGGACMYEVPGPGFFTFHHANAYEVQADGTPATPGTPGRYLVLTSCSAGKVDFSLNALDENRSYYSDPNSRVEQHRLVVDLSAPVTPAAITRTCVAKRSCEFPSVAPAKVGRPHRHVYVASSAVEGGSFFGPNQVLLKTTVDPMNGVGKPFDRSGVQQLVWEPPSRYHFPGEPVFVPRSFADGQASGEEDDGWLMSMVFDSDAVRSYMVILDARTMTEVAKLHLKHHMPAGLHGMFTPEYLGPEPGTPDAEPYDIRWGV